MRAYEMRISDGSSAVCSSDLARGEPAAPPARLAFGAEHPAADLDRFLPGQCRGEHAVGGVPQMMALVEDQPRRGGAAVTRARRMPHRQRMIGDYDVGLRRGPRRMFDNAFEEMRTSRSESPAAPVDRKSAG